MELLKERWFVVFHQTAVYGLGAKDKIFFIGKDGCRGWIGKTLKEIKPKLILLKAKVIELK